MAEPGSIDSTEVITSANPEKTSGNSQKDVWNAKDCAQSREEYTGKVDGWGIHGYDEFIGTPYEIRIPVARRVIYPEIKHEITALTPDQLSTEPFQDFYRHMDMLLTYELRTDGESGEQRLPYSSTPVLKANIDTILERCSTDTLQFAAAVAPNDHMRQLEIERDVILRSVACLEQCEKDPNFRLSQTTVKKLWDEALHTELFQTGYVQYAIEFDDRNRMHGESINVRDQFKNFIAEKLLDGTTESTAIIRDYINWRFVRSDILNEALIYSLLQANKAGQTEHIIQALAPCLGIQSIRQELRSYVEDNPAFRPTFDAIFNYLGLDQGEKIATDLGRDVYAKATVDMSKDYEPYNETLDFELDLLAKEFAGLKKVVDVGCGNGRVMIPLSERVDTKLAGFDMFEPDVQSIRDSHPEMDVQVGDWFDIPFADKSMDGAYCLGRSFTHNITVPDAIACLKEMRRVIKADGFVIVDLPDATTGEYRDLIARTGAIAKEKGILNHLPGLINDSPDNEHYFDRYAPSNLAFKAICEQAGFMAEKLPDRKKFKGTTGATNINEYWKLTKIPPTPAWLQAPRDAAIHGRTNTLDIPTVVDPTMKGQTRLAWLPLPADDGSQSQ